MENNEHDEKMIVTCLIWEVREGNVTKVKIDDDIFVKLSQKQHEDKEQYEPVHEPQVRQKEVIPSQKRKILGIVSTTKIYEDVLNDLITSIRENPNDDELQRILKIRYPNVLNNTITTYLSNYKRYIRNNYPDLANLIQKRTKLQRKPISKELTSKGRRIDNISHNTVFENILNDVIGVYKRGGSRDEVKSVMEKYYPSGKSINTYISVYRRYLLKIGRLIETESGYAFLDGEHDIPIEKKSIVLPIKKRHRRKKRPGSVGLDKRYGVYVMEDEVQKIKLAINTVELNYKATSYNIAEKTKIPINRLRAALHWMADQKMITWTYDDGTGPIYKMMP